MDLTLLATIVMSHALLPLAGKLQTILMSIIGHIIPIANIYCPDKVDIISEQTLCRGKAFGTKIYSSGIKIKSGWHLVSSRPFVVGFYEEEQPLENIISNWTIYSAKSSHIESIISKPVGKKSHSSYSSVFYHSERRMMINATLPSIIQTPSQTTAISKIMEQYDQLGHASIILSGIPGSGKSSVAGFLAVSKFPKSRVYHYSKISFEIVTSMNYSLQSDSPAIIIIDEIDLAIIGSQNILEGIKEVPKDFATLPQIHDVLDMLNQWHGVIIIGTSNKLPRDLLQEFPTCLRKGRFNEIFEMNMLVE